MWWSYLVVLSTMKSQKQRRVSNEAMAVVEQKRAAIRTIVRKVVWDGVNAHAILFGVRDDEIEYPEIAAVGSDNTKDDEETEELVDLSDVDYEDDDMEDDRLGKTNPLSASKTHWGEDSKWNADPSLL